MIEKKISYDINIEKPSKTKPVKQGGVFNYLGKQKTVNAPVKWRSSKDHPIAHLSYITKDEEKILIDLNLYGSLKGKPNRGPFGLPSLQGSGGGSGGDGGSSGGDSSSSDSGPGGSDDGTGHGGPGPGSAGESTGDAPGTQGGTVGEAQASAQADAQSISADNVSTQAQADQEDAATAAAAQAAETGVMSTVAGFAKSALANAMANPARTAVGVAFGPVAAMAYDAVANQISAANRGVTGPSDDTQETTSVQTGPSQSPNSGGGIGTIQSYAPLYNPDTGNPTMDAYMRRLRVNLGLPV
jgi:hypothetical protein